MLKKIEETKSLVFFMIGGILIGGVLGSLGLLLATPTLVLCSLYCLHHKYEQK